MAQLNARETLFLELINRARLDPLMEAARLNLANLNDGLGAGTITSAPKQIVVANGALTDAALTHSAWMNATDTFSHTGSGGSSPSQRMTSAGYTGSTSSGENIAWSGSSSQASYNANNEVLLQHTSLFLSAGHRQNILTDSYREIGIGTDLGTYATGGNSYYGMMSTFDFARSGSASFIGGVTYNDTSGDAFYSIGEGLGGISVQLLNGGSVIGSATSQSAGAYALATTATGALEIQFSGAGLAGVLGAAFTKPGSNIKFDVTGSKGLATNVSATLTQSAANLTLLGVDSVNATGNAFDNVLTGNRGHNVLNGGGGNDTLFGGSGTDTAILSGALADYAIFYDPSKASYVLQSAAGTETVRDVELFQFSDGTRTVSELPLAAGSPLPPLVSPDAVTTIISGGAKGEALIGTDGNNIMLGKGGPDSLFAAGGDDVLNGGKGRDHLTGGDGDDQFNFSMVLIKKNADWITDFSHDNDTIGLAKKVFSAIGAKFGPGEFYIGAAAHDANDKIIYNPDTGKLRYDPDGTGAAKSSLIADIGTHVPLAFDDFLYY